MVTRNANLDMQPSRDNTYSYTHSTRAEYTAITQLQTQALIPITLQSTETIATDASDLCFQQQPLVEPPPYSPSTEDPPPYTIPKTQSIRSVQFRNMSRILALLDAVLNMILTFISGVMLTQANSTGMLPLLVPIGYTMSSYLGVAGYTHKKQPIVIMYIVFYFLRWAFDLTVLVYYGSINSPIMFRMPWSVFGLTLPMVGIRGLQQLILPCVDQEYTVDSGTCSNNAKLNGSATSFVSIMLVMLVPHLIVGVVLFTDGFITYRRCRDEDSVATVDTLSWLSYTRSARFQRELAAQLPISHNETFVNIFPRGTLLGELSAREMTVNTHAAG
ncbi:hypothetical protein QVD99_000944 [Batrachochytrium dendrobatidis]|nr:hypothetical protein QVD99_000944 [Batrachochytrium dendrobatidis]